MNKQTVDTTVCMCKTTYVVETMHILDNVTPVFCDKVTIVDERGVRKARDS